ncbi:MAG: hypothetical protein E7668_01550 [Ruminococcaceae bacterium]|nr:hypothetical protein [Oscillospiraceae bacterium]
MSIAEKKKQTLMKRRMWAIIISAIVIIALAIALVFILDYVKTLTFEDVDGTVYYIRERDDVWGMYDKAKDPVPTEPEHGYYVTVAGTLVDVDPETGEYTVIAVVDTEGNEVVGFNSRILMFPHIEKKNILSLEVHNSHGTYSFLRINEEGELDIEGDFIIASSPMTPYDQEKFASLYVGAGYTISILKLQDPIKDDDGEFTEYGLAPQTRVRTTDEAGEELETPEEYLYEPAYYIITDGSGNRHKVIIGDKLVTGGGYYAQYVDISGESEVKRDAVYVLDADTGNSLTCPVEDYVTPTLTYPMTMTDYFDVENFTISRLKDSVLPGQKELYEKIISFSYVDLAERENTIAQTMPYVFDIELDGYMPGDTAIDACLQNIYTPSFAGVKKLSPSDVDLAEYGLYAPEVNEDGEPVTDKDGNPVYTPYAAYAISFEYDVLDDNKQKAGTIHQMILISEKNEDGNYYAYTAVSTVTEDENGEKKIDLSYTYDMIVEVEGHTFTFLEWERYDWIDASYIGAGIAYVKKITLDSPNYQATFEVDDSLFTMTEDGIDSGNLFVHASDSNGNQIDSFGKMTVVDVNNFIWEITTSEIKVYDKSGTERKMAEGVPYYDYNKLGRQVRCRNGYIDGVEYDVEVKADEIRILSNEGALMQTIVRYDSSLFRSFYATLIYATIVDSYEMTKEEEAALIADPSKHILTMTITTEDADGTTKTTTYSFYWLSSRKAYITINGNGGFYVQKARVDKFISDAQRFFAYEVIEPTSKT